MQTMMKDPTDPTPDTIHVCLHILVVEDNQDSQQLVCELLAALGHRAWGVSSGEQALAELERQAFEVLFTDVSLPGISGIELANQVSRSHPAVKVIFASGYGAQLSRNLGPEAMVLPKPYDIDQLQSMLALVMRRQQGR